MVYVAGRADHKMDNERMVDHIVELVEARAAELGADQVSIPTSPTKRALSAAIAE
jgi:(E)-4-hydroxy-3-methylbut-2-enyl-diphosphate synthase